MDPLSLAEDRVRFLREAALALPAIFLAESLFGTLTPPVIEIGTDGASLGSPTDTALTLAVGLVALAALAVAVWGRRAIVEHRPPWPFRLRRSRRNPYLRGTVVTIVAVAIANAIVDGWWPGSRLYRLDDGRFMWVGLPAEFAMRYIVVIAVFGFGFLLTQLVVGRRTKGAGFAG